MVKFKTVVNGVCEIAKQAKDPNDLITKLKAEVTWIETNKSVIDYGTTKENNNSKRSDCSDDKNN